MFSHVNERRVSQNVGTEAKILIKDRLPVI